MSTKYVDRMFLTMNGAEVQDVASASLRANDGTRTVPTMSRNFRNKGYVSGNREIDVALTIAVQSQLGSPKLESIDYENQDVRITIEHGGDRYTVVGLAFVDFSQDASGVGTEGRKAFNFKALDIIDQVGNSVLFTSGLEFVSQAA